MNSIRTAAAWGIAIVVAVLLLTSIPLYVDWLWFKDLGYAQVFSLILKSKGLLASLTGSLFFLIVWGSASWALKSSSGRVALYTGEVNIPIFLDRVIRRGVEFIVLAGSIAVSVLVGLEAMTHWQSWIAFRNYVPFGQADPIFGIDIGFYVFRLDFILFAYRTLMFALVAAFIAAAAILYLTRTVDFLAGKVKITAVAAGQLGVILFVFTLLQIIGFRLGAYELLFTQGSALYGVTYTDAHLRILSANLSMIAAVIGAALVAIGARRRNVPLALSGVALGMAVNILVGGAAAALVQRIVVNPDELQKESPYLKHHIQATQAAYGLSNIVRTESSLAGTLTRADLDRNRVTLQSVRLWDYRPLQSAYQQLQEIQQYYKFQEVDVDRYTVNGVYRQMMISPREIDQQALNATAKTWVNLRLKFTHGYGLVMSPVNEVTPEGLPAFFLKDIPPESPVGFEVTRPQIYFGERTDNYVIVDTQVGEFDYPRGSAGVESRFEGDSGVRLGGLLRRGILALRFGDLNMVLPGNLRAGSRILFRRNIGERVREIAPFLDLDADPYIVLSEGRMFWMQDAYTTTRRYPYSQPAYLTRRGAVDSMAPIASANYIRNSVKIVVDAYSGEVSLYVFDEADPLIRSLSKAFPGFFKPRSAMPEDLQKHIRYPEDLFRLQTAVFQTFHMNEVAQFYNKADLWMIPRLEQSDQMNVSDQGPMEPYYVIMRLPGAEKEEFIMLSPFTRANKDNMVAWIAAKCDGTDYGKLILYRFPSGRQYYGPAQVQARANQDTEISQQLTLWNQQKSTVYRGNLLVIPIENTMLYVEPLYLQSTNAKIPEFKRVIVAYGNEITMQPTLGQALEVLIGGEGGAAAGPAPGAAAQTPRAASPASSQSDLILRAQDAYDAATAAQKQGNWAEYGRRQKELGDLIRKLAGQAPKR